MAPANCLARRTVLKTAAALAVGGAGLSATAAADDAPAQTETHETLEQAEVHGAPTQADPSGVSTQANSNDAPTQANSNDAPTQADSNNAPAVETGVFDGTVDRIVDGQHVVILVEDGGQVIDQVVEPRDALPTVEEGDSVGVWLVNGEARAVWPR